MLKLFQTSHAHVVQTPLTQFKIPNFLIPLSHLHNPRRTLVPQSEQGVILNEDEEAPSTKSFQNGDPFPRENAAEQLDQRLCRISHPWPEWVELMEQLHKCGYLEGIGRGELDAKDANRIRTACLKFARDRVNLMRYFSSKDIQVIAGSECPVIDRKVVNSGKRLRAHLGIDEGNVCSSCTLRGNCERAHVKARGGEDGWTVDVMRILLTYGLDPFTGMLESKPCLKKLVEESVRRLLREMVTHSMKEMSSDPPTGTFTKWNSSTLRCSTDKGQGHISVSLKNGDWICSKCNFRNFARNTKCLRCDGQFQGRPRKPGENQELLSLKKGDWICDKCNFLNFAKNARCLQCNENPRERQLNPGEWECDSCNYINFRRNMECIKCDHRRARVSYSGYTHAQDYHPRAFGGLDRPSKLR